MPLKRALPSFAFGLAAMGAACTTTDSESAPATWQSELVFTVDDALGGCAVGDLTALSAGNEIAAVGESGAVYLAYRDDAGDWAHLTIAELDGEMIQCVTGDILPERAGDELLVFGMLEGSEDGGRGGAAYVLWEAEGAWLHERVLVDSALLHGGCVADVDPDIRGNELVLAGYGNAAFVVSHQGAAWIAERVAELTGPGKNAVPFGEHSAAIGLRDGGLVLLARERGTWTITEIDRAPAGQSRLAAAGGVLLSARDDGVLAWIEGGRRTELLREGKKLRGAAIGDFDPCSPGLEVATGGYERRLSVLFAEDGGWRAVVVHEEEQPIHHVASGELDAESPGDELVVCGHAGALHVVGVRR